MKNMKDEIIAEGNLFIQFIFEREEKLEKELESIKGCNAQVFEAQKNQLFAIQELAGEIYCKLDGFQNDWDLHEEEKQKGIHDGNSTS